MFIAKKTLTLRKTLNTKNVYLTEINTFPHYHFLGKKDSIALRRTLETNVDLLKMFISLR